MPWTTTLESVMARPDGRLLIVEFTNTDTAEVARREILVSNTASVEAAQARIRAVRDDLTPNTDLLTFLSVGPLDLETKTPTPPTPRQELFSVLFKLTAIRSEFSHLVSQKVVTDQEPTYLAEIAKLEQQAKALFVPDVVPADVAAVAEVKP